MISALWPRRAQVVAHTDASNEFRVALESDGPHSTHRDPDVHANRNHASHPTRATAELITRVFPDAKGRRVVAFASITHGAGVTSTVRRIAVALEHETGRCPVIVRAADIGRKKMPRLSGAANPDAPPGARAYLDALLVDTDCVLIDCEPVETSADISRVASLADGVVLIVEAGQTRTVQIERAVATLAAAEGQLLGIVMNKRKYPIPTWIYRLIH
jgi:hypothetical protein